MMWGTTSSSAKLTGDSASAFEAPSIGDYRLFRSLAENWPLGLLGLLQQYRHNSDMYVVSVISCSHSATRTSISFGGKGSDREVDTLRQGPGRARTRIE
jgi:hypothetical protein